MAGELGRLNILMNLDTAKFSSALEKADYQTKTFANDVERELRRTQQSFGSLTDSVDTLNKRFFAVFLQSGFTLLEKVANSTIGVVDAYGQYSSRLKQATASAEEFKNIQNQLFVTSNRTFKRYEDATELFIRTGNALKQLGYDAKKAADLVSTIQFGLTVDSADTQRTQSVINAISGAILEGKMDMQKFNTIIASSPSLFQALADSITGGSQTALRQLVKEGKLTADELLKITQKMDELGKRADEMPTTVADAFTKLQNNFARFSGEMNDSYAITGTLASGIGLVADNLDVLASGATAFLGAGMLAKMNSLKDSFLSYLETTREAAAANVLKAGNQLAEARLNYAVAKSEVEKAAAYGGSIAAATNLAEAERRLALAKNQVVVANKAYAKANSLVSQGLNLIGGPVGLLTLALTAGAAAWTYFTRNTQEAQEPVDRLTGSIDALRTSVEDLNAAQAKQAAQQVEKNIKAQSDEVMKYAAQVEYLKKQLSEYPKNSMVGQWKAELIEAEGNLASANKELDALNKRLEGLKSRSAQVQSLSDVIVPKGMDKWDEYLKNLENARDIIGLNARELAEFQARQKGANDEQAKIAGIVSAQTDVYKDLQEAIRRKDAAAEAAALENIKNLDIENQRMSLLAQKVIEVAKLLEMVKNGAISAEMGDQLKKTIETTYDIASQHLVQSEQSKKTINTIKANTKPDSKRATKSSGTSGGQSELQSLTKSLQEQYVVLGMTDLEAQKYKINMMQGSAAAKEYAISLAEKISRYKEEAETLKQNRALAEELSVFRDKTFLPLEMMGLGDFAREKMNDLIAVREEYAQKRRQLEENQESESTRISEEAYQARLQALIDGENQKLAIIEEGYQKRKDLESNWALGAAEALNNYAAEANNVYASMNNAVSNAFHGMEDALLDFVMTGKANFKDLANSIIRDLVRIYIQQKITGVFANMLSGVFGGGNITSGVTYGSASTVVPTRPISSFPTPLATGGLVTGPGTATSDSIPAMLSNGEYVINAKATRQHFALLEAINKGRVPVYRAMGGVVGATPRIPVVSGLQAMAAPTSSVTVNITNQSSQPVGGNAKMSTDAMGNAVIEVMLFDLNSNGRYAQQLKSMMGR